MIRPLAKKPFPSSFLSVEKDTETILRKLFVESRPYSDILKSLLVVNGNDCLDNMTNPIYAKAIKDANIKWLIDNEYIIDIPNINIDEFDEEKSMIGITFSKFTRNETNPEFRDCIVTIDCIVHRDLWRLGDYRLRPIKMAGYIDGILDGCRLSGIGTFQFMGADFIRLNEHFSGYTLIYKAIHGSDDEIPREE